MFKKEKAVFLLTLLLYDFYPAYLVKIILSSQATLI